METPRWLEPPRFAASGALWLGFGVVAVACAWRFTQVGSVTLDDSFIMYRVVESWLAGHGPRFNPGDPHFIATSVLWLLMLTTTKALLPGLATPLLAQTLGGVLLVVASALLFDLLRRDLPVAALLAPVAVFLAPSMPSLAGYDTGCSLATGAALLWAHARGRPTLLALAGGAFYLARGEGAVMAAILGLHYLLAGGASRAAIVPRLRAMAPGLGVAALAVGAWHVYHAVEFGALFPASLATKIAQGRGPFPSLLSHLPDHLDAVAPGWATRLLALAGWGVLVARCWPLALWPVVHVALYAALGVPYYHWYYYPLELVALLSLFAGVEVAGRGAAQTVASGSQAALAATAALALLIAPALYPALRASLAGSAHPQLPALAIQNLDGTDRRYRAYADIAAWLAAQPADRPLVLLTPEIGILGYLLPTAEVRDVVGLSSADPDPERMFDFAFYAARHRPSHLVMIGGGARRPSLLYTAADGTPLAYRRVYASRPTYLGSAVYRLEAPSD